MAKSSGNSGGQQRIEISWWRRSSRPVRVEIRVNRPTIKVDGVVEHIHWWVPRKKQGPPAEHRLYLEEGA